jgi:hypothetical protein
MSSIYLLIISLKYDLKFSAMDRASSEIFQRWVYNATHARLGPWMMGITLGYILHTLKDKKVAISRGLNAALWILSLSLMTTVVLFIQPLRNPMNKPSAVSNSLYIAFHRLTWSVALCWIIFACHKLKTGGIVRWFLSLPQWQPIGKMSLSIFLVHVVYQVTTILNMKDSIFFEILPVVRI